MDKTIENNAFIWAKKNRNQFVKNFLQPYQSQNYKSKQIIFLAGSPGSGKTDFIEIMLNQGFEDYFLHLDLDEIRKGFPQYDGKNADCFHKGAIKIMERLVDKTFKGGYNIILDGTFGSTKVVEKNIIRALNKGYQIKIYYVSFSPEISRKYTLAREVENKRKVPFLSFYKQYFNSFYNIEYILSKYQQVQLYVLKKDLTKSGHSGKIISIKSQKDFDKNKSKFKPTDNKISLFFKLLKITFKFKKLKRNNSKLGKKQ